MSSFHFTGVPTKEVVLNEDGKSYSVVADKDGTTMRFNVVRCELPEEFKRAFELLK